jgi:hypothetical protein
MRHASSEPGPFKEVKQMQRTAGGLLTRSLMACAMVAFYTLSALGISSFIMGTPKAEARGRGGRRGGIGRGRGRGWHGRRGRGGVSVYLGAPAYSSCWWSRRRGRWVCPY